MEKVSKKVVITYGMFIQAIKNKRMIKVERMLLYNDFFFRKL